MRPPSTGRSGVRWRMRSLPTRSRICAHPAWRPSLPAGRPCPRTVKPFLNGARSKVRPGWLHSGLLDSDVGVRATPYYAGALQADKRLASQGSIPVTLYVPDPLSGGGLKRVATALVANAIRSKEAGAAEADRAVLLAWGAGEIVRRSLRTSAFVMAHGRPRLGGPVRRRFLVAAIDDAAAAPPLVPSATVPRHSALIELLRLSEGESILPQVLTARTDQDSVLEVVDAQPLVAGFEPALRFRLALSHLVNDAERSAPVSMSGASLSKRQRIVFAKAPSATSVLPYIPAAGVTFTRKPRAGCQPTVGRSLYVGDSTRGYRPHALGDARGRRGDWPGC